MNKLAAELHAASLCRFDGDEAEWVDKFVTAMSKTNPAMSPYEAKNRAVQHFAKWPTIDPVAATWLLEHGSTNRQELDQSLGLEP